MNLHEMKRLLYNGHGRALLWIREHGCEGYEDLILDSCLHERVLSEPWEGDRGDYFAMLILLSGKERFFLDQVLARLRESEPSRDQSQMMGIACAFARWKKNKKARRELHRTFERNCQQGETGEALKIVELDGPQGLEFVLKVIGKNHIIEKEEERWRANSLCGNSANILGLRRTKSILKRAMREFEGVADYLGDFDAIDFALYLRSRKIKKRRRKTYAQYKKAVLASLKGKELNIAQYYWSEKATKAELEDAAQDFRRARNPDLKILFLRFFLSVPYPGDPRCLLRLAVNGDERMEHFAQLALENIRHPRVRAFALKHLTDKKRGHYAISMLKSNYAVGDHLLIEKALRKAKGRQQFHACAREAKSVFQENRTKDSAACLHLIYEKISCTLCRWRIVELLKNLGLLTPEQRAECRYDCNEEIRGLVAPRRRRGS